MELQLPTIAGQQLVAFVLVLSRVGGLFMFAPVFSGRMIPTRVKLVIASALSVALMPAATAGKTLPTDAAPLVLMIGKEICVGLAFALAVGAVGAAIQAGAGLLDTIIGFSFAAIIDPINNISNAILGQLYALFSVMVFLLIGGDHLMVQGLAASYRVVPLDQAPALSSFAALATQSLAAIFVIGLEIAAPVLLALMIVDVAFAIVARAVPQMNVFIVGLPAKILVGFGIIGASLPFVAGHLQSDLLHAVEQSLTTLGAR